VGKLSGQYHDFKKQNTRYRLKKPDEILMMVLLYPAAFIANVLKEKRADKTKPRLLAGF